MRDKIDVMVGDQASVSLDARRAFDLADQGDHLVSLRAMASNVPPAPATEEAIVDCVAFFYEEGSYQMVMFD